MATQACHPLGSQKWTVDVVWLISARTGFPAKRASCVRETFECAIWEIHHKFLTGKYLFIGEVLDFRPQASRNWTPILKLVGCFLFMTMSNSATDIHLSSSMLLCGSTVTRDAEANNHLHSFGRRCIGKGDKFLAKAGDRSRLQGIHPRLVCCAPGTSSPSR